MAQNSDTSPKKVTSDVQWDMTTLPKPTAVDSFDVPMLERISPSDSDNIPRKLYYNSETAETGWYSYMGEWNGRYYFRGQDVHFQSFICSCDKNYENYEKHDDINDAIWSTAFLYNGVLYNWMDYDGLFAYDLKTKEKRLLIDGKQTRIGYGFGHIDAITDGWIWSEYTRYLNSDITRYYFGYQIATGKVIATSQLTGYGADGKFYSVNGIYDPFTGETFRVANVKNPVFVWADTNGDIWLKDMHADGKNYTLHRICDAQNADDVNHALNGEYPIINGYYYYPYTPTDGGESYLARLNLTTGKTEYCPHIPADKSFVVLPHYWGENL